MDRRGGQGRLPMAGVSTAPRSSLCVIRQTRTRKNARLSGLSRLFHGLAPVASLAASRLLLVQSKPWPDLHSPFASAGKLQAAHPAVLQASVSSWVLFPFDDLEFVQPQSQLFAIVRQHGNGTKLVHGAIHLSWAGRCLVTDRPVARNPSIQSHTARHVWRNLRRVRALQHSRAIVGRCLRLPCQFLRHALDAHSETTDHALEILPATRTRREAGYEISNRLWAGKVSTFRNVFSSVHILDQTVISHATSSPARSRITTDAAERVRRLILGRYADTEHGHGRTSHGHRPALPASRPRRRLRRRGSAWPSTARLQGTDFAATRRGPPRSRRTTLPRFARVDFSFFYSCL